LITVLQFSGGKDSLACLYLYREEWETLRVVWVNTGAAYAEMIEYMEMWNRRLPHFIEVKSDQPGNIAAHGLPADVVPMNSTAFARQFMQTDGPLIQPYTACCAANIWLPMQNAIMEIGATRIIRGQRADDKRRAPVRNGDVVDGVEYILPLETWSESDVFAFLHEVDAIMPPGYAQGEKTGRDCWDCTAYLDENQRRIANLPDDRRAVVCGRISAIETAIMNQWHGYKEPAHV
jgi:phosphoadenosine phosphosulfate reductase